MWPAASEHRELWELGSTSHGSGSHNRGGMADVALSHFPGKWDPFTLLKVTMNLTSSGENLNAQVIVPFERLFSS